MAAANADSTDVLIIGGGPVGLCASILLADLGVRSIVVERRDGTSRLPKAHYLNSRTMEILDAIGVADEVYAAGTPAENMAETSWYTSLGGDDPIADRRLVMSLDAFGGGGLREQYERTSAMPCANLPQKHLEPRLRRVAEEREQASVRFEQELVELTDDDAGVCARVRGPQGDYELGARYAIGADGGRTVAAQVGIDIEGVPPFARVITVHFRADLSDWLQEDSSLLRMITRANDDGTILFSGIAAMGPTRWDRHSEEWQLNIVVPLGSADADRDWDAAMALDHIRDVLALPELSAEILAMGEWAAESVLAARYRAGRVLLAGDAAHRHPPTTGLGLNSGIADAHNLAWKLAAVLDGSAGESLLDSYEAERRPVAMRNIQWAMLTSGNHVATQSGWGVMPDQPAEINVLSFKLALLDTPDGTTRLARLRAFLETQRMEYQAREIELGYDYHDAGAVVADGSSAPEPDPFGCDYRQVARPGHRLPHAWLRRGDARVGTHALLEPGAFLLLAGRDGQAWCDAAAEVAERRGVRIAAHRVGGPDAELDHGDDWPLLRGHDDRGVLLVRPDGHVGFRASGAPEPTQLAGALAHLTASGQS